MATNNDSGTVLHHFPKSDEPAIAMACVIFAFAVNTQPNLGESEYGAPGPDDDALWDASYTVE